jgi:arabinofuranosyltransferase
MEEQGVRRQDASPLVLTIGGPLLAVLVFVAVALPFAGFLEDDALISATYSARLLEGHGLTWVDGNRVEGYSNLLWVLTLALIGLVEPDLVIALRILAVTCFAGTVVLLARWTTGGLWAVSGSTMAAILFATAGPVSAWTFGGLEQPLLAILLVAGSSMVLSLISVPERRLREFVAPGTVFGLLCLVRPDAPLFCLPAGLAVLVSGRTLGAALRRVAVLAAMPILAVAGQLAFRLIYYGAWLPNTALVKISPSFGHVGHGTQYVAEGWIASSPLAIAAAISIAALCLRTGRRPEVVYLVAGPAVWSTYLVLVGGGPSPRIDTSFRSPRCWRLLWPMVRASLWRIESGRGRGCSCVPSC